jgi:hypothetical protein
MCLLQEDNYINKDEELNAPKWGIRTRRDSDEAEKAERKIWKGREVPKD